MYQEQLKELEKSIESEFTEKEAILGKFILTIKGIKGGAARLPSSIKYYVKDNYWERTMNCSNILENSSTYQFKLVNKFGKYLGINEKRIDEITDYVYKKEETI